MTLGTRGREEGRVRGLGFQAALFSPLSTWLPEVRDISMKSEIPNRARVPKSKKGFNLPDGSGWAYSSPAWHPKFKTKHILDMNINAGNSTV